MGLDAQLQKHLVQYLEYEQVAANREFIKNLANDPEKNQAELARLLGQRLVFGTAGIRGRMGPGYGQMNDLVIIQTSQGLAKYIFECVGLEQCRSRGVIIGHDARHNSDRFARLAAQAFLQQKIRVLFCERMVPTPLVAFGVRQLNCLAGIMITASHNPKQDNGYKVYWSNGAQILAPHDKNVQLQIAKAENLKPWPNAWLDDRSELSKNSDLFVCVHKPLTEQYYSFIEREIVDNGRDKNQLIITYTSMHGVGHDYLTRALELAGFERLHAVEQQREPDPDFPTVKFPNPEEHSALELAFECAAATKSSLILANDPDADRCAAAEYEPSSGHKRSLNGNEIGALLGWWLWHRRKSVSKAAHKFYMLTTAVSSRFLESMARVEGFEFVETLTGFKYMGNEAERILKTDDNEVLFAYEEAIGYMVSSTILDKDGITAAVQLAQCADYVRRVHNWPLHAHLDWLYLKYGYHFSLNSYYLCYEKQKIDSIFKRLQADLPREFHCETTHEKFQVSRVRDLNLGYDSATSDGRPSLPTSKSSYMVTFFVGQEISLTIRTSGTEPKIKYYSEIVVALNGQQSEQQQRQVKSSARDKLGRFVRAAIARCLTPNDNDLLPPPGGSD